jgi:uncharacterized membrane protein YeaQ/YmgE (transglycosylase-associated protein family)
MGPLNIAGYDVVEHRGGDMTIGGIISAIIVGLVLGVVGRAIAPGKQNIPIWLTIVVGIVAALVGSAIVGGFQDTNGLDWIELVVQIILAVLGVLAAAAFYSGRRRSI